MVQPAKDPITGEQMPVIDPETQKPMLPVINLRRLDRMIVNKFRIENSSEFLNDDAEPVGVAPMSMPPVNGQAPMPLMGIGPQQ